MRQRPIVTLSLALSILALGFVFAGCSDDNKPTASPNNPPVADAGPSQEAEISSQVFLDGSASYDPDGDRLSYRWTQSAGTNVELADSTAVLTSFVSPSSEQAMTFRLTVNDGRGGKSSAGTLVLVTASAGNRPPSANAGADQVVPTGSTVTLNGSGSDPFGGPVTFDWVQYQGRHVTLSSTTVPKPTFTAPMSEDSLWFRLTVKDEGGRTAEDSVRIIVEAAPAGTIPTLYVINSNATVSGFTNPELKDGDIAPELHLAGSMTMLDRARGVAIDANGALLVASRTSMITSWNAGNQTGDVAPDRVVTGSETLLATPISLAVGRAIDMAFVPDISDGDIVVFDGISRPTFDGDVPASRVFWQRDFVMQVAASTYDAARDQLYVYETRTRTIWVFHKASTLNGETVYSRTIAKSPEVDDLSGLFIDGPNDRLYATNSKLGEVCVWDNVSSVRPFDPPNRTIKVGGSPLAIVVDSQNRGYVADSENAIKSYDDIHILNGEVSPTRTIKGASTQLSMPIVMFMLE